MYFERIIAEMFHVKKERENSINAITRKKGISEYQKALSRF